MVLLPRGSKMSTDGGDLVEIRQVLPRVDPISHIRNDAVFRAGIL